MKRKHLLLSALVAVGLQFVQAQEFPSEERIQQIKSKIALNQDSPFAISQVLDEHEFKDWSLITQHSAISAQETLRGNGDTMWLLDPGASILVTMPKVGPYVPEEQGGNGMALYADDVDGDGSLYAIDFNTLELVQLTNTGYAETVGILSNLPSDFATGLSWNSQDDTFYVLTSDATDSHISSLDMDSGELTLVGTIPGTLGIWLEIDDNNMGYFPDINNDVLYSYDFATNTATEIGAVGYNLSYAQDADFDTASGTLYTAAYHLDMNDESTGVFATVDTSTGLYTFISDEGMPEYTTLSLVDELMDGPEPPDTGLACGQIFTDSGGVTGNYEANEDVTYVLSPDNSGDAVTITFTEVDIESSSSAGILNGCWDYLSIYNGPSVDSDVIAESLCGTDTLAPSVPESLLSVGDSFTSTDPSGALTVTFKSDSSVQKAGWQAEISCAVMSVDEVQMSKFNFYPNPTNGALRVAAQSNIEKLELYNVAGQKVLESAPNAMQSTVDMSSLKPGTYILRATVNGKVVTNKVMKK